MDDNELLGAADEVLFKVRSDYLWKPVITQEGHRLILVLIPSNRETWQDRGSVAARLMAGMAKYGYKLSPISQEIGMLRFSVTK